MQKIVLCATFKVGDVQVNTREDEFLMRLNDAFLSCDMPVELQDFLENNVEKLYRDYDFDDPYDNEIFGNKVAPNIRYD